MRLDAFAEIRRSLTSQQLEPYIGRILEMSEDSAPRLRSKSAYILGDLKGKIPETQFVAIINRLRGLSNDVHPNVREKALEALRELENQP